MTKSGKKPDQPTPMMAQYLAIKAENQDCLLFYRMGDFYELFFDDAVKASETLDITLTKRGQHKGEDIPMCGVPVHSADGYLARLIRGGHRVAVCEQTEDPAEAKKRGAKSVVAREVIRLVTPGTLTEDTLLQARANNYLAAIAQAQDRYALAWLDISTGQFSVCPVAERDLASHISGINAGEILIPDRLYGETWMADLILDLEAPATPLEDRYFDSQQATRVLKDLFAVASLEVFGDFSRSELAACGAILDYLQFTQKGKLPPLSPPKRHATADVMGIDPATRRNLELHKTLSGESKGSLLNTIDYTLTGTGARLLAARLSAPLTNPQTINERLDKLHFFLQQRDLRDQVRSVLRRTPDIERAMSRLGVDRGGPRDLAAIREGLQASGEVNRLLLVFDPATVPNQLLQLSDALQGHAGLVDLLKQALASDLPISTKDGGYVAPGYHAALDEARMLRDESRRLIAGLQNDYISKSGIDSLKVKHNNVLGFFIEVPARRADAMMTAPLNETFIHRQTMANAVRFSTVDLGNLERKISQAGDQAIALELEIFAQLQKEVLDRAEQIFAAASALATIDVTSAGAELAERERYCRPAIDDSLIFDIKGGRHPVVEAALRQRQEGPFVSNDCIFDENERIWLVTGPNMAGKSTFLRQNALIAIMAQIGYFVPAESAHIGIVDRLFSRVGAADDLARGRSTFMVEMVETATILNQAGPHALVILDEIGRGTATFDGLSIAWAAVENLHEVNQCRSLFATHYHELTALSGKLSALANVTMRVKEWQGDVIFLHEVASGAADRSYGIQVAKLAGLPPAVVERATEVLNQLEQGETSGATALQNLSNDLPLFSAARPRSGLTQDPATSNPALDALQEIHPDSLSPKEALDLLYELKSLSLKDK